MSNLIFSRENNRELSPLEARIRSIRRRLKNSLERRNSVKAEAATIKSRERSVTMPNRKNQRRSTYPDWESSETDETSTNSHNHSVTDQADAGGASEHGVNHGNSRTNNHAGAARSNQSKVINSSQPKLKVTLAPWTLAVGETVERLEETQRAINKLQRIFISHANDLERVDETSRMLHELEEDCRQKEKEMESQLTTIVTLTRMETRAKAELEREAAQIEKERNDLRQEREKQEKRVNLMLAEEKLKVAQEFQKRAAQEEEKYKKRKTELEDEYVQKRDENNQRATALEAKMERLSIAVKTKDSQIMAQTQELEKIKEQYDLLERAKDSIRKEKQDREAELKAVKTDFALDPRPLNYLVDGFSKIEIQIEEISGKYFHGIEGKDFDKVHEELAAADPLFSSIPIDDSEDSRDLCIAHAQRVISQAICEDVWKPFGSEFTALHPESSGVLEKISDEIDQSDHGGRAAKFWNARTMQALTSLRADSATSRDLESTGYPHPARTDSVISKVFNLSPLFNSSQNESLRKDLVTLVNSAVEIWDNSQKGGWKITVSLSLDPAHRSGWRSEQFDPACEGGETNPDPTSATNYRIFALFPRVLAPAAEKPVSHGSDLPGSWPADSNLTVIHPGKGLPDCSPLVVRGKEAQEERKDFVRTVLENAKKELQSNKRASASGRRGSRGSMSSGTPSEQWKRGGTMDFTEK